MNELSPGQAAAIASGVYLLIDHGVQALKARVVKLPFLKQG